MIFIFGKLCNSKEYKLPYGSIKNLVGLKEKKTVISQKIMLYLSANKLRDCSKKAYIFIEIFVFGL